LIPGIALGSIRPITDNQVNTAVGYIWHKPEGIATMDAVDLEGQQWAQWLSARLI